MVIVAGATRAAAAIIATGSLLTVGFTCGLFTLAFFGAGFLLAAFSARSTTTVVTACFVVAVRLADVLACACVCVTSRALFTGTIGEAGGAVFSCILVAGAVAAALAAVGGADAAIFGVLAGAVTT